MSCSKYIQLVKMDYGGYANKDGEVVIDYKFEAVDFFVSGIAGAKTDGKYGFINRLGEYEIKPKFDSVDIFRFDKALVYKKGKSHWIKEKVKK